MDTYKNHSIGDLLHQERVPFGTCVPAQTVRSILSLQLLDFSIALESCIKMGTKILGDFFNGQQERVFLIMLPLKLRFFL